MPGQAGDVLGDGGTRHGRVRSRSAGQIESAVHDYSWGPDGLVYDSSGNTIYTPGLSQQVSGTDRYPLHDWLGSSRYLTDGSQVVKSALRFDAFGNRSQTGGTDAYEPSDFQFGAGWGYQTEYANGVAEPGLGLQYLQQRYYDPAVGRFISQDPIGLSGGFNAYGYCGNDPVNCADPTGTLGLREFAFTTLVGSGVGLVVSGGDPLGAIGGAAIFTGRLSYAESGDLPRAIADGLLSGTLLSGVAEVAALGSTALAYQFAEAGPSAIMCGAPDVARPRTFPAVGAPTAARLAEEEAEYGDLTPAEEGPDAVAPRPTRAYDRLRDYGRTPTRADKRAIGGSPDHRPVLVERYYEGDPSIGEKPGYLMTPEERRASAADRSRMFPATEGEQNRQGADMSRYSRAKKREFGLD